MSLPRRGSVRSRQGRDLSQNGPFAPRSFGFAAAAHGSQPFARLAELLAPARMHNS